MYAHSCSIRRRPLVILGIAAALSALLALPPFLAAQAVKTQRTTHTKKTSKTVSTPAPHTPAQSSESEPASIDVLEGIRTGQISAVARGKGDGQITLSLTNKTSTKLRVVLPPGLIVSGATGQFGGMGGMGGGMGGMGGGMGGMGGMMGGGMRSVPPTGPFETTLQPNQERHLPTSVVSMNGPGEDSQPLVPAEGETLRISGVKQWTDDKRTLTALHRLAEAKAPPTIAQMVVWYVTAGAGWDDIGRLCQGWGNAHEIALAKGFVASLEKGEEGSKAAQADPGLLYWEIKAGSDGHRELAAGVRALWEKYPVLGLTAREGVPEHPAGPALACRAEVTDAAIEVKLSASHPSGTDWVLVDRFRLKLSELERRPDEPAKDTSSGTVEQQRERSSARLADALAGTMVERLVRISFSRGPRVHGKESFRIKIINDSPLILNGLAVSGSEVAEDLSPSVLQGLSLPPQKSLVVAATPEEVKRLRLKEGTRVVAADLSGL